MKYPLLVLIFILLFSKAHCQEKNYPDSSCLKVMDEIKENWKIDSVGKTGFRLANYKRFQECKINFLPPDVLLNIIGKCNEVWRTEEATIYLFYVSQKLLLSKKTQYTYLSFRVTSPTNAVIKIGEGIIER